MRRFYLLSDKCWWSSDFDFWCDEWHFETTWMRGLDGLGEWITWWLSFDKIVESGWVWKELMLKICIRCSPLEEIRRIYSYGVPSGQTHLDGGTHLKLAKVWSLTDGNSPASGSVAQATKLYRVNLALFSLSIQLSNIISSTPEDRMAEWFQRCTHVRIMVTSNVL